MKLHLNACLFGPMTWYLFVPAVKIGTIVEDLMFKEFKSLNFTIYRRIQQCFRDLNQYKIVVPLFGAAYSAPNKGTTILY